MSTQNAETKQELVVIDQQNTLVAFQKPDGLDPVIEEIRQKVKSEVYDISTKEGRDRIGSVARQIGSAKRRLKEMSQGLTSDWQTKTKIVTSEASRMEKELDSLRDEIKAPLDAYKKKEEDRIAKHECHLAAIRDASIFEFEPTIEQVEARLEEVKSYERANFEEFVDRKNEVYSCSEKVLTEKLSALKEQKAKDAELDKLRKEKEEREQKERDDQIAKDAADKATKDAEDKAEKEKIAAAEKVEADKVKAQQEADAETKRLQDIADKAEKDKADAETKAEESAESERQKIADEEKKKLAEAKKREDDKAHNKKINNEALTDILKAGQGVSKEDAKNIVIAIAQGKVKHVTISY